MKKLLLLFSLLTISAGAFAQVAASAYNRQPAYDPATDRIVTFRFVPGDDMFYIPWDGNDAQLTSLYALVDQHKAEITGGLMPVYVDGYSSSMKSASQNRKLAFTRANRVKSELITHKRLTEGNFITKNYATSYTAPDGQIYKDMVVVTLRIPSKPQPEPQVEITRPDPRPAVEDEPVMVVEEVPVSRPHPQPIPEPLRYSRWSVGANVGLPFFWGDMTSTSPDKTYIGVVAGVQVTYQASPMFGITLSFDWAQNRAGSRGYAKGYLLDASGMTWYTPQSFATQAYGDLYSKINMYSVGLHVDVNVNRLFGPRIANSRLKLIVSPAIYGQHFSSKVYTRSDDKVFAGERLSKDIGLGLGGDVVLRYNVSRKIDVQVKGKGIWINDNLFDNIRTVGYVKQNAMWGVSAGVVWKLGTSAGRTNLLHKKK